MHPLDLVITLPLSGPEFERLEIGDQLPIISFVVDCVVCFVNRNIMVYAGQGYYVKGIEQGNDTITIVLDRTQGNELPMPDVFQKGHKA